MRLPADLAASAADDLDVAAWCAGLPTRIAAAAARWTLDVGAAYEPGGSVSWVAPARRSDGADVVLKIGRRHSEAQHEAAALATWDGAGAVRLLDSARPDEGTQLLLLERCEPGSTAADLPPLARDVAVAGVLRQLWIPPSEPHPFEPLADMCAAWAAEVDLDEATRLVGDAGLVRAGLALFAELAADCAEPVLLATDLHAGNVLAARRAPWLAIDPKPYVGDRTYDALQHMFNCPDRLRADPLPFCARMAGLLDLDVARLRQWLLARLVVEGRNWPELATLPRELA